MGGIQVKKIADYVGSNLIGNRISGGTSGGVGGTSGGGAASPEPQNIQQPLPRSVRQFLKQSHMQTQASGPEFDIDSFEDGAAELYKRSEIAYNLLPKDSDGYVPLLSPKSRIGDYLFYNPSTKEITTDNESGANVPLYWSERTLGPSERNATTVSASRYLVPVLDDSTNKLQQQAKFDAESAQLISDFYYNVANPVPNVVNKEFKMVNANSLAEALFENKKGDVGVTYGYIKDLDKYVLADTQEERNRLLQQYGTRITFEERNRADISRIGKGGLFGEGQLWRFFTESDAIPTEMQGMNIAMPEKSGRFSANVGATFEYIFQSLSSFGKFVFNAITKPIGEVIRNPGDTNLGDIQDALSDMTEEVRNEALVRTADYNARLASIRDSDSPLFKSPITKSGDDWLTPEQGGMLNPTGLIAQYAFPEKALITTNSKGLAQAAALHNFAYELAKRGTTDGFMSAIDTLVTAYNLESTLGSRDVYTAHTWINSPEKKEEFFRILAQVELQKKEPLTRLEVLQLKQQFVDPSVELVGGMFLDTLNLLDIPAGAAIASLPETNDFAKFVKSSVPDIARKEVFGATTDILWAGIRKTSSEVFGFLKKVSPNSKIFDTIEEGIGILQHSRRQVANSIYNDVHYLITRTFGADVYNAESAKVMIDTISKLGDDVSALRKEGLGIPEIKDRLMTSGKYTGDMLTDRKLQIVSRAVDLLDPLADDGTSWANRMTAAYDNALKGVTDYEINKALYSMGRNVDGLTGDDLIEIHKAAKATAQETARGKLRPEHIASTFAKQFKDQVLMNNSLSKNGLIMVDQIGKSTVAALGNLLGGAFKMPKLGTDTVMLMADLYNHWLGKWVNSILSYAPKFWAIFQPLENYLFYHFTTKKSLFDSWEMLIKNNPQLIDNLIEMPVEARRAWVGSLGFDVGDSEDIIAMLKKNKSAWLPGGGSFDFWVSSLKGDYIDEWRRVASDAELDKLISKKKNKLFNVVQIPGGKLKGKPILVFNGKPIRRMPETSNNVMFSWKALGDAGKSIAGANELVVKTMVANDQYIRNLTQLNNITLATTMDSVRASLISSGLDEDLVNSWLGHVQGSWNSANGSSFRLKNFLRTVDMSDGKMASASTIPNELFESSMAMNIQERDAFLRSVNKDLNNFLVIKEAAEEEVTSDDIIKFFDVQKQKFADQFNTMLDDVDSPVAKNLFGDRAESGVDYAEEVRKSSRIKYVGEEADYVPLETKRTLGIEDEIGYGKFGTDKYVESEALSKNISDELTKGLDARRPVKDLLPENVDDLEDFLKTHPEMKPVTEAYTKVNKGIAELREVRSVLLKNIDDEPTKKAFIEVDSLIDQMGNQDASMFGSKGFFTTGFPAYKMATGETRRANYLLTLEIQTRALEEKAKYIDELVSAAKGGKPLPYITTKEYYRRIMGVEHIVDSGRVNAVRLNLPGERSPVTFGWVDMPDGSRVDSPMLRRYKASTNIFNQETLDAPFSLEDIEFTKIVNSAKEGRKTDVLTNRIPMSPEDIKSNENIFLFTYLNSEMLDDDITTLDAVEAILGRKLEPAEDARALIEELKTKSDAAMLNGRFPGSGSLFGFGTLTKDDVGGFIKDLEYKLNYFSSRYINPDDTKVLAKPLDMSDVPEVNEWAKFKIRNSAQQAAINDALDKWMDILIKKNDDGDLFLRQISDEEFEALNKEANSILQAMSDMEDVLWNGGVRSGIDIEGATDYMKRIMRAGDESALDQFMKGIFPFWSFAAKGGKAWVNIAKEHPELVALYYRSLRFSQAQAYKYGAVNSRGQQIESTKGKIYIPEFNLWFDPSAVSPFLKYFFPQRDNSYEESKYEELPPIEEFLYRLRSAAQMRGFGISPLVDIFLTRLGMDDPYSDATWEQKSAYLFAGTMFPAELIPPFMWNTMNSISRKISFTGQDDLFNTKVQWFDYLVENEMLKDYWSKIKGAPEAEKNELIEELMTAIQDRENSTIWNEYYSKVENTTYYQQLSGFFTGIYPKPFTPADAEMTAIKNSINLLGDNINQEMGRTIFFPYMDAEQAYEVYMDSRYETPEGEIYGVRNTFSWVTDLDGNPIEGEERRKAVSANIDIQRATDEYFDEKNAIWERYNMEQRSLAIGGQFSDPRAKELRTQLYADLLALETSPKYDLARKQWSHGYKPDGLVYSHYRDIWWSTLFATYPRRDREGGESYDEWRVREAKWRENIPALAQELVPIFTATLMSESPNEDFITQLIQESNAQGYDTWDKDKDTIDTALFRAWQESYSNGYWDAVSNKKGNIRLQAEKQWLANNRPPDSFQLLEAVKAIYGDRWADEEILDAMSTQTGEPREILDAETAQDVGKSEAELKRDEIWDIYSWTKPGSGIFDRLNNEMLRPNPRFDSDNWYTFFNSATTKAFGSEEEFNEFYNLVTTSAASIGLRPPTGRELQLKVQAEKLNEQLDKMLQLRLGGNYKEIVDAYYSINDYGVQKTWRDRNPQLYAVVTAYSDMRSAFAKQNPIWEMFYKPPKGTAYHSDTVNMLPIGNNVSNFFVNNGGEINEYSTELPKAQSSMGLNWDPGLLEIVSPTFVDRVERAIQTGGELSDIDINYIKRLIEMYPEYENFLDDILEE